MHSVKGLVGWVGEQGSAAKVGVESYVVSKTKPQASGGGG